MRATIYIITFLVLVSSAAAFWESDNQIIITGSGGVTDTNNYVTGITITEDGEVQNVSLTRTGLPTIWATFIDNNSGGGGGGNPFDQWLNTTDNSTFNGLQIRPQQNFPASTSTGGAINLDNTGNTGAGFILYDNSATSSGRLMNLRVNNIGYLHPAFHIDYNGVGNAAEIVCNTNDSDSNCLSVVSYNVDDTVLGITGYTDDKGVMKFTHWKPAANDANAAAMVISLRGTGTAAQGLYIDAEDGGTTGKLLNIRNAGNEIFVLDGNNNKSTFSGNVQSIKFLTNDWSNITITESQISDLSHTADTNCDGEACSVTNTGTLDGYQGATLLDDVPHDQDLNTTSNVTFNKVRVNEQVFINEPTGLVITTDGEETFSGSIITVNGTYDGPLVWGAMNFNPTVNDGNYIALWDHPVINMSSTVIGWRSAPDWEGTTSFKHVLIQYQPEAKISGQDLDLTVYAESGLPSSFINDGSDYTYKGFELGNNYFSGDFGGGAADIDSELIVLKGGGTLIGTGSVYSRGLKFEGWGTLSGAVDIKAIDVDGGIFDFTSSTSFLLPVKTSTGDPSSPIEGQVYVNTVDNKARVYEGGSWRDLATW